MSYYNIFCPMKTQIIPKPQLKMLQLITLCKEVLVADNRVHIVSIVLERPDPMEMKMLLLVHVVLKDDGIAEPRGCGVP